MSLAHRIAELEALRLTPQDHPGRESEIKRLETEIAALAKKAGIPDGTKFRAAPKAVPVSKASKVSKPKKK